MKKLLLSIAFLLCASQAHATCTGACIQASTAATASTGTTCAPTLASGRTAGHLLVAEMITADTTATMTATDTDGNTWADDAQQSSTNGVKVHILSAKSMKVGAGAYTLTITSSATIAAATCGVAEYSFNSYTSPYTFDKTKGANGTATAVSSGVTATLATANELVIGAESQALGTARTVTAGTSYTLIVTSASVAGTLVGSWEYQNVAAATAIAATFTNSGTVGWDALVATYFGTTPSSCKPTLTLMHEGRCG